MHIVWLVLRSQIYKLGQRKVVQGRNLTMETTPLTGMP